MNQPDRKPRSPVDPRETFERRPKPKPCDHQLVAVAGKRNWFECSLCGKAFRKA